MYYQKVDAVLKIEYSDLNVKILKRTIFVFKDFKKDEFRVFFETELQTTRQKQNLRTHNPKKST